MRPSPWGLCQNCLRWGTRKLRKGPGTWQILSKCQSLWLLVQPLPFMEVKTRLEEVKGHSRNMTTTHPTSMLLLLFRFKILFYSWERQRKRQRHRQREKKAPCGDPGAGLNPRTPRSWPEPKADTQPLSHPGVPMSSLLFCPVPNFILCSLPIHQEQKQILHMEKSLTEWKSKQGVLEEWALRSGIKYSWLLNNTCLHCVGPLICGFFDKYRTVVYSLVIFFKK